MERANASLVLHFTPSSKQERAIILEGFADALADLPLWAVDKAFGQWDREGDKRPAPAHIRKLAQQAIKVVTDELARREKEQAERQEGEIPQRSFEQKAEAERILHSVGFNKARFDAVKARPMAGSEDELFADRDKASKPHWSELVDPNGPEMAALRKARLDNPLMAAGMAKNVTDSDQERGDWRDDE